MCDPLLLSPFSPSPNRSSPLVLRNGKRERANLHNYKCIMFSFSLHFSLMPGPEVGFSYLGQEVRRSHATGSRKTSVVTGALLLFREKKLCK